MILEMKIETAEDGIVCSISRTTPALTLNESAVGKRGEWTLDAKIHCDYFTWINQFEATKPSGEYVRGDLENVVYASSIKALGDFFDTYGDCIERWDYEDI